MLLHHETRHFLREFYFVMRTNSNVSRRQCLALTRRCPVYSILRGECRKLAQPAGCGPDGVRLSWHTSVPTSWCYSVQPLAHTHKVRLLVAHTRGSESRRCLNCNQCLLVALNPPLPLSLCIWKKNDLVFLTLLRQCKNVTTRTVSLLLPALPPCLFVPTPTCADPLQKTKCLTNCLINLTQLRWLALQPLVQTSQQTTSLAPKGWDRKAVGLFALWCQLFPSHLHPSVEQNHSLVHFFVCCVVYVERDASIELKRHSLSSDAWWRYGAWIVFNACQAFKERLRYWVVFSSPAIESSLSVIVETPGLISLPQHLLSDLANKVEFWNRVESKKP